VALPLYSCALDHDTAHANEIPLSIFCEITEQNQGLKDLLMTILIA